MSSIMHLQVSELEYQVAKNRLLKGVSFSITSGELVGIIGPNGAGKSSLMKCLSGFQPYTQGCVEIQGQNLKMLSHNQRALSMSYLPQYNEAMFPFSVIETIELGFYARQQQAALSHFIIKDNILAVLERVGIAHLQHRLVTELSGGERQLVHFARLLVQDAPLMLLDEPTASLDIGHESQLMNALRYECQQQKSALIAIHNLNTAAEFCDRLILLNQGEVMAEGKPNEVLTKKNMQMLYQDFVTVSRHSETGNAIVSPYNWRKDL